jgi:hypothetical protein
MKLSFACCSACLLLAAVASTATAQFATPQLASLWPPGGRQGTSVEVMLAGSGLEGARQLRFSHPGITAQPKLTPPTELEPARPIEGQFVVQIAGDVPSGLYEAYVVGPLGLSNPRHFAVGVLPEMLDAGGNTTPDKAPAITPPLTVSGRLDPSSVDYYKLRLKPDQRVLIELAAAALDSRLRGTLTVFDPQGREVASARGQAGGDPLLAFTATLEGDYLVAVADRVYGGGNDYFYRLSFSTAPQIAMVFPPFGPPGSTATYALMGFNLPGGQPVSSLRHRGLALERVEVSIPLPADEPSVTGLYVGHHAPLALAWQDAIAFRPRLGDALLPSVPIYFGTAAPVLEQEPNDDPASPQRLTAPCELAGQFYPEQDQDWYEFSARKGETFWIEVVSHQWGLPTDPALVVYRVREQSAGQGPLAELAQVDDPPRRGQRGPGAEVDVVHLDPSYKFIAPEDGTYRLLVRDQAGDQRRDATMVYRLAIRTPRPDFRLLVWPSTVLPAAQQQTIPLTAATIRRGGTAVLGVLVERRDELASPIEISVEGLPEGVQAAPVVLPPDAAEGSIVLVARDDAAAWVGSIRVVGRTTVGSQALRREARYAATIWGTANRQQEPAALRLVSQLELAVLEGEPAPAWVKLGEGPLVESAVGGTIELPVAVVRRGDFKGTLQLTPVGLPQTLRPQPLRIEGNQEQGKWTLALNQANLRPGDYTFFLKGETSGKFVRNPAAVAVAEAEQKRLADLVEKLTARLQAAKGAQDAPTVKALEEQLKQASQAKTDADKRLDAVKKANPSQDTPFALASTPLTLRVHASPIVLKPQAPSDAWPPSSQQTLRVDIQRLFGFKEKIDLSLTVPNGVKGISAPNVSIPSDQTQGQLAITLAADATPGSHACTLKATSQFNNIPVQAQTTVMVTIASP